VTAWLSTDFLADVPKYAARVDKVRQIAERHVRPGM
jgi:ribose 5-phosphate isomerase B